MFVWNICSQKPFQGMIEMLHGSSFFWTVRTGQLMICKPSLYVFNQAIETMDHKQWLSEEIVPTLYNESLLLFSKILADWIPPHWPGIKQEMHLKQNEIPDCRPLYSMVMGALVILTKWLEADMWKALSVSHHYNLQLQCSLNTAKWWNLVLH